MKKIIKNISEKLSLFNHNRKGMEMTMSQLIYIIIGVCLLAFVFLILIPALTSEGCSGISKLFGGRC